MSSIGRRPAAFLSVIPCGPSPDAWPIEVGWGFSSGEVRTMRLAPAPAWSLGSWDKSWEADHRLALEELLKEGKEPLDACLILNAALGQSDVFAASPERDSLFLFKLYKAAGVDPNYRLNAAPDAPQGRPRRAEEGVRNLREEAPLAQTV